MRYGVVCLVLFLAACAGYSITEGGKGVGYDVYRPEPYLLRTPISSGSGGAITGFKFEVQWLPNYSKRYRVHSWTGFGASDIKFTFKDGWMLTDLHDKSDNTKVLEQLTSLTKHLIPADPMKIAQSDPDMDDQWDLINESNTPVLYRIVFNECGEICGLRRFRIEECAGNAPSSPVPAIKRTRQLPGPFRPGSAGSAGNTQDGGGGEDLGGG